MQINPADAGINAGLTANIGHKIQWLGLKDAPQNTYFSFDALMTSSMGLGIIANKQKMGLLDISYISLNYSYRIALGTEHSLGFGASINFCKIN